MKIKELIRNHRSSLTVAPILFLFYLTLPTLKLFGFLNWSWTLVFAPIWTPFIALFLTCLTICFLAVISEISFIMCPDNSVQYR